MAKSKDGDNTPQKNWFAKHKVLTVIGVIILLAIISSAAGGGNKTNNNSASSTTETKKTEDKPAEMSKIGDAVRDGKFEFVVKSVKCGNLSVGADYTTKTAQGQYCFLTVSVKNIGNEPQSLFSSNQYLYNAENQKYSADDEATYTAGGSAATWYSDINPGNSVEGVIVFDLPKDKTPVTAELHDSMASGGVKVTLK